MSNKGDDNNKPLDLGLGSLLADSAPVTAEVKAAAAAEVLPSSKGVSALKQLSLEGKWPELLTAAEKALSDSGNQDSEAGILWVRANFETKSMPLSVLAAPLDSMTRSLEVESKDQDLRALAAQTLVLVGAALYQGSDRDLGLVFLERAQKFDPVHALDFSQAVKGEISRLSSIEDLSTRQKEQLQAKISTLKESIEDSSKESAPVAPLREGSSAFGLIGMSAITVFGGILLLGVYFGVSRLLSGGNPGEAAVSLQLPVQNSELRQPELLKPSGVNAFDGLYYDLQNDLSGTASQTAPTGAVMPVKAVEHAPLSPAQVQEPKKKEVIDTSGPKESEKVKEALRNPEKERSRDKETAEILFGKNQKEPQPNKKPDIASGYDVERFLKPRTYRVIARTPIVAQPGFRTEVVGQLVPGDRIVAEARIESWLQIRSSTGRIGYVLIQDMQW